MKTFTIIGAALLLAALLSAQTGNRKRTDNKLSPPADTSMALGGHKITIEYNAPSARNRQVEGGLIPHDKVWRLGADSATTLTTEADVMIGNLRVPKGVHTLYLQGGEKQWQLIVNKQIGQWGTQYDQKQDLGRVEMTTKKLDKPAETLKIELRSTGAKEGVLEVTWGTTQGSVPVRLA